MNELSSWNFMPSRHAEIDAYLKIKKYKNIAKKLDFFVIRITKAGALAESRPCFHCIDILAKSRLNICNVYYSVSGGKIVCESFANLFLSTEKHITKGFRHKAKK
jgi:hypothetical protein